MNSVNLVGNVANSVKSGNNSATAMLAIHRIYSQARISKQLISFQLWPSEKWQKFLAIMHLRELG